MCKLYGKVGVDMAFMNFSKIAFKNLFSKPATEKYPFEAKEYPERYRGRVVIDIEDCVICGLCAKRCPANAITVDREKKTWTIERMSCVQCSHCVDSCAKKCLHMEQKYTEPAEKKVTDVFTKPEEETKKTTGGKPQADTSVCVFCTLCAKNCPVGALTVDRAEKKWELNKETCVGCGLCASKCPKKCIEMK